MPVRPLARALPAALVAAALLAPSAADASRFEGHVASSAAVGSGPVVATTARAPRATASGSCANANLMPNRGNVAAVRAALLCLHNKIRARYGLPHLRENRKLRKAAVGHSANMVRNRYFDHTDPNGATFVQRVLGAGYVHRNQGWSLGENIAWGTGTLATPRAIMNAWMHSAGHRANILRRSYREIGIGIAVGAPNGNGSGATVTADFGVRR